MAGNFEIVKNNFVGFFEPANCSVAKFRPWISFLNEHSLVSTAISVNAPLKSNLLRLICTQSVISNEVITFVIGGTQYRVDESVVRTALNFPADNLVGLPTDQELASFFQDIHYEGPVDLTRLSKSLLVDEWSSFFDTLIKVFANCTKTSFSNIPSLLQYIGFAVAYNRRINFAQLTWHAMVRRIIAAKRDYGLGNKVSCYYPRFLSVILHHILSPEHMALYNSSPFEVAQTTTKKFFTRLATSLKFTNVPVVVTPYLSNFIQLPTIQTQPPVPQPPVDQSTHAGVSAPGQVNSPPSAAVNVESQVDARADQGIVAPQSPSQVIVPNNETLPQTSRPKLPVRRKERSNKVGSEREPTALPPHKKSKPNEATVSPSVSSQQDMDYEMADIQYLGSFSQQDDPIEIRHRAMALVKESHTLALLQIPHDILVEEVTEDTVSGRELVSVTVPTIVTVEESSQTSEGKSDPMPDIQGSFSPLTEGTSLSPLRDFPLADLSGESGRQLAEFTSEEIQTSNLNEFVDSVEDWELRTPIAPPLTSLEEARVISIAGTSRQQEIVRSETPLNMSETVAREQSETLLSDRELSAHTDTYTLNTDLLEQIRKLQEELAKTKAENQLYKAQVEERSSSSTSVQNQLNQLKTEVENIRLTLTPKLNSIQETQMHQADDIASTLDSHAKLDNYCLKMDYLQGQIFTLQDQLAHTDIDMRTHFKKVEGSIDHLTTGMSLLYSMVKKINTTTPAERTFFEGGSGGGGEGGSGSGAGSGSGDKAKGKEDPHSHRAKSVEDSSTKGEKSQQPQPSDHEADRSDKGKGKQHASSDEDYYYLGEQDDFDAFNMQEEEVHEEEELPGVNEQEQEVFDEYEEQVEVPSDPAFNAEFNKQSQDLKRKQGELEKISQVITKKAELLKAENQEKQRLHNLKVQRRKLDVRLKLGDSWDMARRMFGLPQKSTNNDKDFFQLLDSYRTANPDNSTYMEALRLEISRIVAGFDQMLDEMVIFIYCQQEGSFKVSLNLFENRTLSELWILINKVSRSSNLNELLRDHLREFAVRASPQVISMPYSVKFFRSTSLQTCNLDQESLKDYPAKHLVWIENMLRTTGFATRERVDAADMLQTYCMKNIKRYEQMKNRLKSIRAQPVRPSSGFTERDRLYDRDLFLAMKLQEEEFEEGEIRKED